MKIRNSPARKVIRWKVKTVFSISLLTGFLVVICAHPLWSTDQIRSHASIQRNQQVNRAAQPTPAELGASREQALAKLGEKDNGKDKT
jgi:hypothetical protein